MRYREIIAAEAASPTGTIKPKKPLTPAQAMRRADRNRNTEKRIRDEETTSARKVADLRAELL